MTQNAWGHIQWGVPSWVINDTIAGNVCFLSGKVRAISLCCFEWRSALAYGEEDLPGSQGEFQWHLHLPLDLPWSQGGKTVAQICQKIYTKVAFLQPQTVVLHPPAHNAKKTLTEFRSLWGGPIMLENTRECDVEELGSEFLKEYEFGFCFDFGHAISYGQFNLFESPLLAQADIWHWSSPGDADRHLPLTYLHSSQRRLAQRIWKIAKPTACHVLEIFNWPGICESVPILAEFATGEYLDVV